MKQVLSGITIATVLVIAVIGFFDFDLAIKIVVEAIVLAMFIGLFIQVSRTK